MKKIHWKSFFKGITFALAVFILFGGILAVAAPTLVSIPVYFNAVNDIVVEGESVTPTQPIILYNDTTYVPFRYMGEIIGKEVSWDQATRTIYYGEKPAHINEPTTTQGRQLLDFYQSIQWNPLGQDDIVGVIINVSGVGGHYGVATNVPAEERTVISTDYPDNEIILMPQYAGTDLRFYTLKFNEQTLTPERDQLIYEYKNVPGDDHIVFQFFIGEVVPLVEISATFEGQEYIWRPQISGKDGNYIFSPGFAEFPFYS